MSKEDIIKTFMKIIGKINLILSNGFEIWRYDMWVMLMSNCALVRILMLRFVIPYASTKINTYAMKFISYLWCIHSVLLMLNAWVRDFLLFGWSLLNLFASLHFCTKYDRYLCIQNPLNQFCHMSPLYLPICGISMPF